MLINQHLMTRRSGGGEAGSGFSRPQFGRGGGSRAPVPVGRGVPAPSRPSRSLRGAGGAMGGR